MNECPWSGFAVRTVQHDMLAAGLEGEGASTTNGNLAGRFHPHVAFALDGLVYGDAVKVCRGYAVKMQLLIRVIDDFSVHGCRTSRDDGGSKVEELQCSRSCGTAWPDEDCSEDQ